jgi:hypothetical protein
VVAPPWAAQMLPDIVTQARADRVSLAPLGKLDSERMVPLDEETLATQAAGLGYVVPHQLRHTYATAMEVSGVASAASFGGWRERRGAGLQGQRGAAIAAAGIDGAGPSGWSAARRHAMKRGWWSWPPGPLSLAYSCP